MSIEKKSKAKALLAAIFFFVLSALVLVVSLIFCIFSKGAGEYLEGFVYAIVYIFMVVMIVKGLMEGHRFFRLLLSFLFIVGLFRYFDDFSFKVMVLDDWVIATHLIFWGISMVFLYLIPRYHWLSGNN